MIPIQRIIDKLDSYLASDDKKSAESLLEHWVEEAEKEGDMSGLLSVLNEQIGFYRRNRDVEKGQAAIDRAIKIMEQREEEKSFATIYVNIATTLRSYDEDAMKYYDRAEELFNKYDLHETYEYAAFLNNRATALADLGKNDEAMADLNEAMKILDHTGGHLTEIALTLANMAQAERDRDMIGYYLDRAWDTINHVKERDGAYAFALTKLAPTFRQYGRRIEADAMMEVVDEIYGRD